MDLGNIESPFSSKSRQQYSKLNLLEPKNFLSHFSIQDLKNHETGILGYFQIKI